MDLYSLQQIVREFEEEKGFAGDSIDQKLLHLVEEVAETIEAHRIRSGNKLISERKEVSFPQEEICHVIFVAVAVANRLEMDLQTEMHLMLDKATGRTWKVFDGNNE